MDLNIKWKFIHIKPNCYVIHSAEYEDKYIFSFFSYQKLFFGEQAISFKRVNEILQKLVALPVLTFVELGYM